MKALLVGLGIIGVGLLAAPPAYAVPITEPVVFEFTSDHCTGGCGTAPFGTVTLTQDGTSVDVVVHLFAPNYFVKTGAGDNQAFKFNGTDIVLADITVDAHIPGLVAATGTFNGDGTGEFDFGINCPTCGGGASSKFNNDIAFTVANATIADLTAPNNLGNIFVADILSDSAGGGTGNTGPVDVSGGPVPEPTSLLLIGSGMAFVGGTLRRRWKRR